jgi:hypothetical protein
MYMGLENVDAAASPASQSSSEVPFSQSLDPEERNKLQLQIYSGLARNWNEEFQVRTKTPAPYSPLLFSLPFTQLFWCILRCSPLCMRLQILFILRRL